MQHSGNKCYATNFVPFAYAALCDAVPRKLIEKLIDKID
jgi:hypothetical protein